MLAFVTSGRENEKSLLMVNALTLHLSVLFFIFRIKPAQLGESKMPGNICCSRPLIVCFLLCCPLRCLSLASFVKVAD